MLCRTLLQTSHLAQMRLFNFRICLHLTRIRIALSMHVQISATSLLLHSRPMSPASMSQSLLLRARVIARRVLALRAPRALPLDCRADKLRVSWLDVSLVPRLLPLRCLSCGQGTRGKFRGIRWLLFAWETGEISRRLMTRGLVESE